MRKAAVLFLLFAVSCASSRGGVVQPAQTTPAPTQKPPSRAPVRFAVIGDWGAGTDAQYELARRMCRWREKHPFRLVFTTGDNIYPSGEPENFEENFFRPYKCLRDNGVRFRAVLGNHDIGTDNGQPELDEPAFGMKDRNYVVRKERRDFTARFVMWESNYSDRDWLRRNLGNDDWTIVSFHHPVYSPGPHGPTPGYRPGLPRLFARRGVDLVLNAHDHLYARMPAKRRVRYLVTGGGGAGLYDCERDTAELCLERYHFLYVVVRDDRILIRAVPLKGTPIDYFSTAGRD